MKHRLWLLGLVLPLAFSLPLFADWDPGMDAKWVQLPDLDPTGIDVNCSPYPQDYLLADDFLCTEKGPITELHLWGSWRDDFFPQDDPGNLDFHVAIYSDIPAALNPDGYSIPGEPLWETFIQPGMFVTRMYWQGPEGWMDPPEEYLPLGDTLCWQYNFRFDEATAFVQDGSPDNPVVYWLVVKAFPHAEQGEMFGWKTSNDHWNDDAVWGIGDIPMPMLWRELFYPPQHEIAGLSIDLAFVLNGPIQQDQYDFGDAPDAPYPTTLANNGAYHTITNLMLGGLIDGEPDGQPNASATGDDMANIADEDGVVFTSVLKPGQPATVDVTASIAGLLDAWVDFNASGSWEASEVIFSSVPLNPGVNNLSFNVPAAVAENSDTFARFRLSSAGGLGPDGILPSGAIPDGEVEDYKVHIEDRYAFKWIQDPDLDVTGIDVNVTAAPGLPAFILADDFLCDRSGPVTDIHIWGSWLADYEPFDDDPGAVVFTLSFHADVPADTAAGDYSHPGEVLWIHTFQPGEFQVERVPIVLEEGWMNPPDDYIYPGDTNCWRYRFYVPPHEAFHQEGSEQEPLVYWLDVQARPVDKFAWFGWKTSMIHWNDDATWGAGEEPYPGPWSELRYPPQHQFAGHSMDMAFALYEDLVSVVPDVPDQSGMLYNAPNPFNPITVIHFTMPPDGGNVRLEIFDMQGRLVRVLVDGFVGGGPKTRTWDGRGDTGLPLSSGVYLYRLRGAGVNETTKMLMVR